jgi:thiamine biosynthesis lipoprotein ApbE
MIRTSAADEAAGLLELRRGAVATSETTSVISPPRPEVPPHHRRAHTDDIASVTVTASCSAANAYTISVMALGPELGAEFLRRGGRLRVIIASSGAVANCNMRRGRIRAKNHAELNLESVSR